MLSPNPVPSQQPLQQWKAVSEVDSTKQDSDLKISSFDALVEQNSSDFESSSIVNEEIDAQVVGNESTEQGLVDDSPQGLVDEPLQGLVDDSLSLIKIFDSTESTSAMSDDSGNLKSFVTNPESALDTDWQFNETVISVGQSESTLEIASIDFDQSQIPAEFDESSNPIILNFQEHAIFTQASVDQSNRITDPTLDLLDGKGAEPRLIYPINLELNEAGGDAEIQDSNAFDDTLLGDIFQDKNSKDSDLLNQRNPNPEIPALEGGSVVAVESGYAKISESPSNLSNLSLEIPALEGAPVVAVESSLATISESSMVEPSSQVVSQAWIQPGSQSPITSGTALQLTTDHLQPASIGSVATQQLGESLVREVSFDSSSAEKKMTLYLHPAELGRLTVEIGWESETVSASIVASERATSEMLDRDRQWLMDHLKDSGLELTSFDVSHEGSELDRESGQGFEFAAKLPSSADSDSDRRDPTQQAIENLIHDGGRARLNIVA
ncbi:MAG: flagellar hook-length control protein FliK [Mariniblastus sp.]|jgi:flagellar hook-length control protein FliK